MNKDYKSEKFFFVIEPFGHINFFADSFKGIHPDTLNKLNKINQHKQMIYRNNSGFNV